MAGRELGEMRFDASDLEQARALGAAHGEGWQSIIVGEDVAAPVERATSWPVPSRHNDSAPVTSASIPRARTARQRIPRPTEPPR